MNNNRKTMEQITADVQRQNPEVTLADGTKIKFNDLKITDDLHFDAYYDYLEPLWLNEPASRGKVSTPTAEKKQTHEQRTKARIGDIESDIEKLREKMAKAPGKFSAEIWKELNKKTEEVTDLKERFRKEQHRKDAHRRRFLRSSFGTDKDFERLWEEKLRDEAILDETKEVRRHSIYSDF